MESEYLGELKRVANDCAKKGARVDVSALGKVADVVSKVFAVQPAEVAFLAVSQKGRFLRFLIPEKLQSIGQIPLTSTSSLAARTAREKRPEIVNHFVVVPHASVFEAVPLAAERGDPIQKIMSAPITLEQEVVGVVQVSRKAQTAAAAGPDFTQQELRDLVTVAGILAPCIPLCARE